MRECFKTQIPAAPLAFFLGPLILGYAAGHTYQGEPPSMILWGISGAVLVWLVVGALCVGSWFGRYFWKFVFFFALWVLFLLAWQYIYFRNPLPGLARIYGPAVVDIELVQVERKEVSGKGYVQGVAKVIAIKSLEKPYLDYTAWLGQKVYVRVPLSGEWAQNTQLGIRSQLLRIKANLRKTYSQTDNGFMRYLWNQGIAARLSQPQLLEVLSMGKAHFQFFAAANRFFKTQLARGVSAAHRDFVNILSGMLLGGLSELPAEKRVVFKQAGALHLFAVSGLHIGIIAGCLYVLLRLLHIRGVPGVVLGLSSLLVYVYITGAGPSAMRAFLMVSVYWAAPIFSRKRIPFCALLASALIVLILNPYELWGIGFQFSYGVVAVILLLGVPGCEWLRSKLILQSRHPRLQHRILFWFAATAWVGLAAHLASLPLGVQYFQYCPLGGILLSPLIMPVASLIITLGFVSLLGSCFFLGGVLGWLNQCAVWLLMLLTASLEYILELLPSGLFYASTFKANWPIGAWFVVLLITWSLWGHLSHRLYKAYFWWVPFASTAVFLLLNYLDFL